MDHFFTEITDDFVLRAEPNLQKSPLLWSGSEVPVNHYNLNKKTSEPAFTFNATQDRGGAVSDG